MGDFRGASVFTETSLPSFLIRSLLLSCTENCLTAANPCVLLNADNSTAVYTAGGTSYETKITDSACGAR